MTILTTVVSEPISKTTFVIHVVKSTCARRFATLSTAYIFARLCLSLPAAAVADPLNLDGAWDVSQGNGWRLAIVVVLVPSIVPVLLQLIPKASMTLWLVCIGLLLQILAGIYGFAVLSESYRALGAGEWRPEPPATPWKE